MIVSGIVWSITIDNGMLWVLEVELRLQMIIVDLRNVIMEIERIKKAAGIGSGIIPAPNPGGGRIVQPRGFMMDPTQNKGKGKKGKRR